MLTTQGVLTVLWFSTMTPEISPKSFNMGYRWQHFCRVLQNFWQNLLCVYITNSSTGNIFFLIETYWLFSENTQKHIEVIVAMIYSTDWSYSGMTLFRLQHEEAISWAPHDFISSHPSTEISSPTCDKVALHWRLD